MAKILAIDDEQDILTFVTNTLSPEHQVSVTENWIHAVEQILKENFDLILLDIKMPGLSGDKLADVLKKRIHNKSLKIVLFSGIDESELRQIAQEVGAAGYIRKPCDKSLFLIRIQRFLKY
jgi:CheY-like chemotaxis protein